MSEMAKTMSFVAAAVVALAAAYISRPVVAEMDVQTLRGENLTRDFSDPDAAKQMRIVRFNDDTATLREFEVAEEDGLWTIPSKDGYPADAEQQMALAATSLMDREILQVASDSAADHELFGVVDPLSPKLAAGQKGVGTRVTMSDIHDEPLVDLIIGGKVKDTENQHYVREADRDAVYVVEIDPTKLSTDFEDWIEKDLLKLNPWDIEHVEIKDYSAELVPVMTSQGLAIQVAWDPRAELTLGYSDKSGKWTAETFREFNSSTEQYDEFQLTDEEELNTQKLDALKTALGDVRLVDVVRKPAGLSADLKAGDDFLKNTEARQDLRSRGFAVLSDRGNSGDEIISSEGEVICTMNNGVEYVLRFGDLQVAEGGSGSQTDEGGSAAATEPGPKQGVHRYLFVMARFNEDAVPKPELQELPALPAGSDEAASEAGAEGASSVETTAGEAASAAGEPDTGETASAVGAEEKPSDETTTKETDASESETPTDADQDQSESTADASMADEESTDKDTELARIIAERKRIEAENQQKLDQYQAILKQGRAKVKALNARFGDWYYVVSNDVFQKIRLSRDDVIKKKGEPGESPAQGVGAPGQRIPGLPSIPGVGQ